MKKFYKILIVALTLVMTVVLFSSCSNSQKTVEQIQKSGKLTIATSPDFPPFEYLENGNVVGIEIDILQDIADELGVELVIEQMDFDSVIPAVQSGKFDVGVSGITVNEKRKENVDFSDPYFLASQAIVVNPNSEITCKNDLTGKKISVQTGTTAEDYCISNGYEVLSYVANNDAAAALSSGKVDAWVVDNEVAVALANEQGLVVLDEAMTTEPYSFAFAKGSDAVVQKVNEIIAKKLSDGSIAQTFEKYDAIYVSPVK